MMDLGTTSGRRAPLLVASMVVMAAIASACSTTDVGDTQSSAKNDTGSNVTTTDPAADVEPGPTTGLTDTTIKIAIAIPDFRALTEQGLVPDLGDVEAEMRTYVAHLNDSGGIAGREIIASYHTYDAYLSTSILHFWVSNLQQTCQTPFQLGNHLPCLTP